MFFDTFLPYKIPLDVVLFSYIRGDFVYCPFFLVRFTNALAEGALLWKLFVGGGAGEAGAQMEHALCKAFRR